MAADGLDLDGFRDYLRLVARRGSTRAWRPSLDPSARRTLFLRDGQSAA